MYTEQAIGTVRENLGIIIGKGVNKKLETDDYLKCTSMTKHPRVQTKESEVQQKCGKS